jgi:pilus assembly protein Flp/PilA
MKHFWKNEEGQGMVEYGLIIALVAVVVIVGISLIGTNANTMFSGLGAKLTMGS